jgi:oligopeptidase A
MLEILAPAPEMARCWVLPNYSELSLASKMAETFEQVHFLRDLGGARQTVAEQDLRELQAFAAEQAAAICKAGT